MVLSQQTLSAWEGALYLCMFFMSRMWLRPFAAWWHFGGQKLAVGAELPELHFAEELLFVGGRRTALGLQLDLKGHP